MALLKSKSVMQPVTKSFLNAYRSAKKARGFGTDRQGQVVIGPLDDPKKLSSTQNKRLRGMWKKCHELSTLCKGQIFVLYRSHSGNEYAFASHDDIWEEAKSGIKINNSEKTMQCRRYDEHFECIENVRKRKVYSVQKYPTPTKKSPADLNFTKQGDAHTPFLSNSRVVIGRGAEVAVGLPVATTTSATCSPATNSYAATPTSATCTPVEGLPSTPSTGSLGTDLAPATSTPSTGMLSTGTHGIATLDPVTPTGRKRQPVAAIAKRLIESQIAKEAPMKKYKVRKSSSGGKKPKSRAGQQKRYTCAICSYSGTNTPDTSKGKWFGCEYCDSWCHGGCLGLTGDEMNSPETEYICVECKEIYG